MNVDVQDKFFWFVVVELLCGFAASVAFISSGYVGISIPRYDAPQMDSVGDFNKHKDKRSVQLPPSSNFSSDRSIDRSDSKFDNDTNIGELLSVQNASDSVNEIIDYVGGKIKQFDDDRRTRVYMNNILIPGAFFPMVFRVVLFTYDMKLESAPQKFVLMLSCIILYIGGGVVLLIDDDSNHGIVRAIFAIIAGAVMIPDLIFQCK